MKDFRILGINQPAVAVKSIEMLRLELSVREKAKNRLLLFLRNCRQQKLFSDAFCRKIHRARVLVVIAHEGFTSAQDIFLRIIEFISDLTLKKERQEIGGTLA